MMAEDGRPVFTYDRFAQILNEYLEREALLSLIKSMVEHPERFTGPFRPSTQVEKLLQHILQSKEILFGDAVEEVFAAILQASGYERQEGTLQKGKKKLECDLLFKTPDRVRLLLVEQKLRDDHDSTKRRGQIDNFREKVDLVEQTYGCTMHAIMHFVDPAFRKNKVFYSDELRKINETQRVRVHSTPLYGAELFDYMEREVGHPAAVAWQDLESWLRCWKHSRTDVLGDMLNWDSETSTARLRNAALEHPALFARLASQKSKGRQLLWEEGWLHTLSPTGKGLRVVAEALSQSAESRLRRAGESLRRMVEQLYKSEHKPTAGGEG